MAQNGDTITYTFSNGSAVQEDISSIDEITIDYVNGAPGGGGSSYSGSHPGWSAGGRAENVTVDVSSYDTLYIWVGEKGVNYENRGRFNGYIADSGYGGGGASTEVAFPDQVTGNADAPAIAGAGGGGGATWDDFDSNKIGGSGGARGGSAGGTGSHDGDGTAPPQGGDGGDRSNAPEEGDPGDGYINSGMSEVSGGSVTLGGGNSAYSEDGEVQISYTSFTPTPPSDLSATVV